MEQKQLNFDQPLLSTRRYSSTGSKSEAEDRRKTDNALSKVPPLPKYKSELKSGPVRNPGTVPFVWEQMPGRPKKESKPQTQVHACHPIIAPKLPPGRILNVQQEAPDGSSEGTAANCSQARNGPLNSQSVPSVDKSITMEVSNEGELEVTRHCDKDDDNEVYVDAVDTLSRSEFLSMTCSISGVSGLDDTDFSLPETYPTDPQAIDFMIGRFLPAAKAMASEIPQHSDKRRIVPKEQQTKKAVSVAKWHPPNPYKPNNFPYYAQSETIKDTDDEDDDNDSLNNTSHKLCGLFPRLCLQNSFCLLNPVLGMRKQPELLIKSVRTRNLKSYAFSHETANKCEKDALYEKRFAYGFQAKVNGFDQVSCKNAHGKLDGSSPYRDLQDRGVNAFHKEGNIKDSGFLGIPEKAQFTIIKGYNMKAKDSSNLQEVLVKESNEWAESSASSPMVERTLYIDTVYMAKPKSSISASTDMSTRDYNGNEFQMLLESPKTEGTVPRDAVLDGTQNNSVQEKSELQHESMKSLNYHSVSLSHTSVIDVQLDVIDVSAQCKDLDKDSFKSPHDIVDEAGKNGLESHREAKSGNSASSHDIDQNPVTVASSKFIGNEMIDLESRFPTRSSDRSSSDSCNTLRPLPPPLPKSPSESWLKRALPAVASRNPSRSPFVMSIDPPKTHGLDPKWETIVKASNVPHGHLRFSEELLAPIPEA